MKSDGLSGPSHSHILGILPPILLIFNWRSRNLPLGSFTPHHNCVHFSVYQQEGGKDALHIVRHVKVVRRRKEAGREARREAKHPAGSLYMPQPTLPITYIERS